MKRNKKENDDSLGADFGGPFWVDEAEGIVLSRSRVRPVSTSIRIVKERNESAEPRKESIQHVWEKVPDQQ